MDHTQTTGILLRLAFCTILAQGAFAAESKYPVRPLQLVVPFQAGSSVDIVARIISPGLGDNLGQPIIVVNRPGAGSTIGIDAVAKATPDGHVLGVATLAFATNTYFMTGKVPYDARRDLQPVSLMTRTPLVLTVNTEVPARTVKELIALAKAKPDTLNYASAGIASSSHLAGALFASMSGIRITHIPFSTTGSSSGLAGNQTHLTITGVPSSLSNIKSGRVVALAVTTAKPVAALPGIPSMSEAGVPGFEVSEWAGILVAAGTPRSVVERQHREIVRTLSDAGVRQRIENLSVQVVASTPREFSAHLDREFAIWAKVAADINAAERAGR